MTGGGRGCECRLRLCAVDEGRAGVGAGPESERSATKLRPPPQTLQPHARSASPRRTLAAPARHVSQVSDTHAAIAPQLSRPRTPLRCARSLARRSLLTPLSLPLVCAVCRVRCSLHSIACARCAERPAIRWTKRDRSCMDGGRPMWLQPLDRSGRRASDREQHSNSRRRRWRPAAPAAAATAATVSVPVAIVPDWSMRRRPLKDPSLHTRLLKAPCAWQLRAE